MWTDDYKHISYTTLTLHYIDDNCKRWSKVLFTCEFPDDRKTANNIRMELSRRLVKLGLQPDILSKLIFVVDRGTNIVCALQLCIKLQFPYDQYHTKKYLQKEIPGTIIPHINLLTLEFKDVTIPETAWSCTSPENHRPSTVRVTLVQQNGHVRVFLCHL
jgi:hypothetical protein